MKAQKTNGEKKDRKQGSGGKDYCGEWYIPDMPEEEYADYRMREKGYAAIAAILHIVIGFLPSMGLNLIYSGACYMAGLILVIYMTVLAYRGPSDSSPKTREEYRKYGQRPRILTNVQRVIVILTLMLDVIATYQTGLGIGIWFILQMILLLLEALDLQFLFRMQRKLGWETTTKL